MLVLEELDRYQHDGDDSISEMNVIPFIDICLVLLIIVLVTTSFSVKLMVFDHPLLANKGGQAGAHAAGPATTEYLDLRDKQGNLQVAKVEVKASGRVLLNGREMPADSLGDTLRSLQGSDGACPPLLVVVDRKAKAQYLVTAVDQIHRAGNVKISYTVTGAANEGPRK
jgi:biopolymer transport protein ExbD